MSDALAALSAAPRGFVRDARFTDDAALVRVQHEVRQAETSDPLELARAEGFSAGAAQARTACQAEQQERDAARAAIEIACARLDEDQTRLLAERLRATVFALCDSVLAEAAIDSGALTRRVERAARMLARADDARVIRLHPDDLALVARRLPAGWDFEPDPELERGDLRIEGTGGGVEDGPGQWRRAIEEALRAC
ncbi:MAG: hypothetical protein KGL48_16575 [Sphingomonadales bacterium]|nr:hypothetical protein [Sphingomonadales bacterium]MDE2569042.1 hypothetical protein [Sphingomonadales bacterium]